MTSTDIAKARLRFRRLSSQDADKAEAEWFVEQGCTVEQALGFWLADGMRKVVLALIADLLATTEKEKDAAQIVMILDPKSEAVTARLTTDPALPESIPERDLRFREVLCEVLCFRLKGERGLVKIVEDDWMKKVNEGLKGTMARAVPVVRNRVR